MPTQDTPLSNDNTVDGQRFKTCPECGEIYDAHDFAQYAHHTNRPHERLPLSGSPTD